jgi:RNA polymerase sigma factor for flagellar operon FliA
VTPATCALQELAVRFAASKSAEDRAALCEAALPLVRRIAGCVLRRLPPYFTIDDLVGDGSVGLLRAVDRFDPRMGSSFEHWAGRIVRGAIFNGLRRMDFVPERVRRDARTLEASRLSIAQRHGSSPTDAEAAASAGLDEKKLDAVRLALRRSAPHSIDMPAPNTDDTQPLRDKLRATSGDPASRFELLALRQAVGRAVSALPARERLIVASFYAGNVSLRQIGDHLGISKQRVSQLHGRALVGLRAALAQFSDV